MQPDISAMKDERPGEVILGLYKVLKTDLFLVMVNINWKIYS